jgi:erythrocyte band 7 integral membrane protein
LSSLINFDKILFSEFLIFISADPAKPGVCSLLLALLSMLLVMVTLPASLFLCIKVVQEYERAVIFRLGRLRPGGAKGPGIFFVMPCIDSYKKVDLRTVSFDVPPQEVLVVLSPPTVFTVLIFRF